MCDFEEYEIISKYTKRQAVDDGILIEVLRWNGIPVMATTHISEELGLSELIRIWREFRFWFEHDKKKLPEEDQLFSMTVNGKKVWVIEDPSAFTIMFPEDY
jgi:hypothetical protein